MTSKVDKEGRGGGEVEGRGVSPHSAIRAGDEGARTISVFGSKWSRLQMPGGIRMARRGRVLAGPPHQGHRLDHIRLLKGDLINVISLGRKARPIWCKHR